MKQRLQYVLLGVAELCVPARAAFSNAISSKACFRNPSSKLNPNTCSLLAMTVEKDSDIIRLEIEEMRLEALRRVEQLSSQISCTEKLEPGDVDTTFARATSVGPGESLNNGNVGKTKMKPSVKVTQKESDELALLDDTRWKIMMTVGREEARSLLPENAPTTRSGTWMPKTWGISGERLAMSLDLVFTRERLSEPEEFLNTDGVAVSKVLNVVNQELTLGPSMTEGSRTFRVRNGGWKVCKGEGPLSTDILRFYFEVMEEVSHQGGDVYCPAGRVYCTCGYFPQLGKTSIKERLREAQESVRHRYDQLYREVQEDDNWFSLDKTVKNKRLYELRIQAGRLAERMNKARVREPDRGLLRLSQRGDVGLTREGGLCCKVKKTFFTQYNILGKFGIGSVEDPKAAKVLP